MCFNSRKLICDKFLSQTQTRKFHQHKNVFNFRKSKKPHLGLNGWWWKCSLSMYNNNYVTQNICNSREFQEKLDNNICAIEKKFCMRIFFWCCFFWWGIYSTENNYSCKLFLHFMSHAGITQYIQVNVSNAETINFFIFVFESHYIRITYK